jgi:NHS family xanthosine MFS transporter
MSISQISETLLSLAIPFFLRKFGIKYVMLFSMLAWVLRFGLFAFGDPAEGLWMIVLSCIVYGMAFDFFNISGSLICRNTNHARDTRQRARLIYDDGKWLRRFFGSIASGVIIDNFSPLPIKVKLAWHLAYFCRLCIGYRCYISVCIQV